jgi:hypothetical protein
MYKRSGYYHCASALLIINNMQILLLLPPLPLSGRRQIIVRARPVVLQIMERQVLQFRRFNPQVLESLCGLVDYLIQALLFHFVCRQRLPEEVFVHVICNELEDGFGHIYVPPLLDDFSVGELGDRGHGVVFGPVQLECLASGGIVEADLF